jgi:two-component system, sensor histidine kinase and response regulator
MKKQSKAAPVGKKAIKTKPKGKASAREKIQKLKTSPVRTDKEEFRRYHDYLNTLMDNTPDYIYFKDEDSRFLRINKAHTAAFGLSDPAQAIGKSDFDFFSKEHAQPAFEGEQEIIRTGKPIIGLVEKETRHDGSIAWVSTTKMPLYDGDRIVGTFGISRDITPQKLAEEVLDQERSLLNALMDNVPDYIYFKDRDSRFLRINKAHAKAFGLNDPAEAIGKSDFDFFTKDHAQPAFEDEQTIIRTGRPLVGLEEKETRADGRESWVSTNKMPLCDSHDHIIGTFGVSRDITEQKRAEIALRDALQALKKANEIAEQARATAEAASQAKGMFLARMSHEIRTPMNSVIGFSDMLLDTEMSEEQGEFVRNITKSGEALLSLINEILDFSKIEAGQLTFQNIDFDLEITAFDVCSITQPRLGNKSVEILCHVGDDVPGFIKSDPTRIRQVLLNLMGNATKFTEEGEIELVIDVEKETDKRLKLHTTVRDTGIGIPKDKLEIVFELFQQADGSVTRKYGGTGLGLAICREIAKMMEGEVWVESELGKGSTFHFTAWVDKSEKVLPKTPQIRALAGKKALLVDDNESNLIVLSHALNVAGMRTVSIRQSTETLANIQKAVEENDPYDIVILDIQMPEISGYEVALAIRKDGDPRVSHIKILAFSSSISRRIKLFKESGFDGFLPKPIQRPKLLAMLKRLIGEEGGTEEPPEKQTILTQHALADEAKHAVRILLAEDNPMNQRLAQVMLTKAGYQLDVANNGKEAVEKYTAGPERFDLIFMDLHMPELDGLEATTVLRNRGYKDIPIIAMTADAMKEDRDRCLESGMNDYMAKPIRREEVFAMVKKWVFKET